MRYVILIFVIVILSACSVKYDVNLNEENNQEDIKTINQLQEDIKELSAEINKSEAYQVAKISILYSKYLANEYELVQPPLYHNSLIQMGLKKRGLCFHFAQDLIDKLKLQNLKTIDLHWVVHDQSQYWEHSSIILSAKGKSIQEGIVLDAWRNSGNLYWSNFINDTQYNWIEDITRSQYYGTIK